MAAGVCTIACSNMQYSPTEATLVDHEMGQAYGTHWSERLLASRKTNQELYVEMVTAYYEAVDANTKSDTQPTNWVGYDYILNKRPPMAGDAR